MDSQNPPPVEPENTPAASFNVWPLIAFGFAIFIHVFNNSHFVTRAGFFTKCFSILVATLLGSVGAAIGNGIRQFAMPDRIWTSGGMGSLIWNKVFWMVGPQVIGLVIGAILGMSWVLK